MGDVRDSMGSFCGAVPIANETMGVYGGPIILRVITTSLVEAKGEPMEANQLRQNLTTAVLRRNVFSIITAGKETIKRIMGINLYPIPHFIPEHVR